MRQARTFETAEPEGLHLARMQALGFWKALWEVAETTLSTRTRVPGCTSRARRAVEAVYQLCRLTRDILTDEQWERLRPLLPPQKRPTGRPSKDHHTT